MTNDARMAALMTECLAELAHPDDAGQARALQLLGQVEALSPGLIEQMAARLQLARLPRTPAH